jgi:hypothetical protein
VKSPTGGIRGDGKVIKNCDLSGMIAGAGNRRSCGSKIEKPDVEYH